MFLPLQAKNRNRSRVKDKYLSAMDLMKLVQEQNGVSKKFPEFSSGDTITVHYKIKEGNKERIQQYRGVVIQRKGGSSNTATFTVRKMSGEIGVERIFPLVSPFIEKIEVNKYGKVRRARIFYFRDLTGKKARIAERRFTASPL
jgi:large subunit ribosomal protein L19